MLFFKLVIFVWLTLIYEIFPVSVFNNFYNLIYVLAKWHALP